MKIENRLKVIINNDETEKLEETKKTLNEMAELILSDPERKSLFSANRLKEAADVLDNIINGNELY